MAGKAKFAGPVGTGARFKALKAQLAAKGTRNPGALAAKIGRRKYGKPAFQALAKAGKARHGLMHHKSK